MKDQYGRTIDYLRISITDACNLRCRYCMPESAAGCALEQAEQNPPLTVEEMLKIVHAAAGLGITHYRITGGEPLVRKECVELVQKIKAVPGTASVGITTNGVRLASCARDLKAAGCDSVNVSLDTVDAAEFAALTGRDALEQVKQGICAAKEAGLLVKLNAVHRKELHAQELIEFAEQEKVPVRFIEVMPVGAGKSYVGPSNEALKTELEQRFYYLYQNVYGEAFSDKMDVTYRDYYQSWKLRGDNPELYRLGEKEFQNRVEHQQRALIRFDRYAFNAGLQSQGEIIRSREKLRRLYYAYHYSRSVREKGEEQEEFKVDQRYAELVRQVQDKMIAQLAKENIAIETNPSSNYLIGTIKKYDEHPILRFNSRKLVTPEKNMSLSVSINTDDQGVFDTLLENEYALMTLALKKSKDKDNQPLYDIEDIYEWVDYVREMGLEQSFK